MDKRPYFTSKKNLKKLRLIHEENTLLDYGCGSGSFSIAAAKMVGLKGKVVAADIHPLALKNVERSAHKNNLTNIKTVLTDCDTGLSAGSIDRILFFDTLHNLSQPHQVLKEFYRVLRSDGILSMSDHHLKKKGIFAIITKNELFKFHSKKGIIYNFTKC